MTHANQIRAPWPPTNKPPWSWATPHLHYPKSFITCCCNPLSLPSLMTYPTWKLHYITWHNLSVMIGETQKKKSQKQIKTKKITTISAPILFFLAISPPSSHLNQPPFQSFSRFTGTGFVRTKCILFYFSGGSHNTHPTAVHARVWTPVRTRLSTPWDGAITARPKLAGRQRRLTTRSFV